ncbi:MAG: sulfite exporter TauE/SafE family protein [Fidelibacterota bacterium]|nr:MAG: sulfite exporter TauE/SafE family protein [Candidatus Neomarinimicrobiota bacterium]
MDESIGYWYAFLLGLIGSLHCIGMCGPIAVMLPGRTETIARVVTGRLLYNIGRTLTYALMGLIIGFLGRSISLAGYQQAIGFIVGGGLIASVLLPARVRGWFLTRAGIGRMVEPLKRVVGALLTRGSNSSLLFLGICNGFLPCGLVYAALGSSLMVEGPIQGMLYMANFGVGTIPVMLAMSFTGKLFNAAVRRKLARLLPVGVVILGLLFILRGLSLGIPYISPDVDRMMEQHTPHGHG